MAGGGRARLDSGLLSFEIDMRYTDDFGVNVTLKEAVSKAKFDFGGEFSRHEDTIWRVRGHFDDPPAGAPAGRT